MCLIKRCFSPSLYVFSLRFKNLPEYTAHKEPLPGGVGAERLITKGAEAVSCQNLGCPEHCLLGQESAVIAKAYRISRVAFFLHKYAQARCQKTDIFFGELIRYDAAPSAGSEFDHTSLPFLQKHPWRCIRIAKGAVFVAPVFILLQECLRPEADCAAAWHRRGTPRLQYRSTVLLRYLPEHRQ